MCNVWPFTDDVWQSIGNVCPSIGNVLAIIDDDWFYSPIGEDYIRHSKNRKYKNVMLIRVSLLSKLIVNIFSASEINNINKQHIVKNVVDNTVVGNTYVVTITSF